MIISNLEHVVLEGMSANCHEEKGGECHRMNDT